MVTKLYADILIQGEQFYWNEVPTKNKSALELLGLIQIIVEENLPWANPAEGVKKEDHFDVILKKAIVIKEEFVHKALNIYSAQWLFGNVKYDVECLNKIYTRIENLILARKAFPLPSEMVKIIYDHLSLKDIAQLSLVNKNGHALSKTLLLLRAQDYYSFKDLNPSSRAVHEYLFSLLVGLKSLSADYPDIKAKIDFGDYHSFISIEKPLRFESTMKKLKDLIQESPLSPIVLMLKKTLIEYAEKANINAVRVLLICGIDPNTAVDGKRALFAAQSNPELIQALLSKNANPNLDNPGDSPLWKHLESPKITQLLCEKKADVEKVKDGKRPLHATAEKGWTKSSEVLLNHGAVPNSKDTQLNTPLHVVTPQLDLVDLLLDKGADPNIPNSQGIFPLCHFIDYPAILSVLHKRGAKIELCLALHYAAKKGALGGLETLLKCEELDSNLKEMKKINPNMPNKEGLTPLHFAKNTSIIKLLCMYEVDLNIQTFSSKFTALHMAVKANEPEKVLTLLECGANPLIKDIYEKLPINYTEDAKIQKMLKLYASLF